MKVYRLEHESLRDPISGYHLGPRGAYGLVCRDFSPESDELYEAIMEFAQAMDKGEHLTPFQDPKLCGIDSFELCGVSSKKALHYWFGKSLKHLLKLGFVVHEYDVPDEEARCGLDGQVVFSYADAKLIEKESK